MVPAPKPAALSAILGSLAGVHVLGLGERTIRGVAYDSRGVEADAIFVALAGERVDGHDFIAAAIDRGASAVVVRDVRLPEFAALAERVTIIGVADPRRALSRIAAAFYGEPSHALPIAGVTGTNGKTTVTYLIEAIAAEAGLRPARIGTLGVAFGNERVPTQNTTPFAPDIHATLAALLERQAGLVTMEVSSHALEQDRVADVAFAVAAFTNLTRDHLDYHGTMDAYAAAKRKLFDLAVAAVINVDDPYGAAWSRELSIPVTSYALESTATLRPESLSADATGTAFLLDGLRIRLPLPGRFNVANALAAIGVARVLGIPDATSARALGTFERVPGRMDVIERGGIAAVIDYAHTPDALERVLLAARDLTRGRLIAVFGCGGDRDPGKRAQMGAIASRIADATVVTSDNPRSEDPAAIAEAIVQGCASQPRVELDRRRAIRDALASARPGDVIVVAGKGHETYQIVGDRVLHFDDREEVEAAFAARAPVAAG